MATFADLRLSDAALAAVREVGYESPSPIQEQAIPVLLAGKDVIGQAQTGTGKTAAFGLPMVDFVDPGDPDTQALVLTPTRELCIQVTQALRTYGARKGIDVVAVFGGAPIRSQQAQLRAGGQIVVGTVGRVLDLISRHSLMLTACRFVVLDEADEMLDLGFFEDVERILSLTPGSRQTALFSATIPPEVRALADKYLLDPVTVKVKAATLTIDTVEQFALKVAGREKNEAVVRVLRAERPAQAIVFVRTKIRCDQLFRTLRDSGFDVRALHGDMTQGARDGVMISFKEGRLPLLVATDVAARGLDITSVTHVINYDIPTSPDVYVHRIGRTGRVGRSGRAITFARRPGSGARAPAPPREAPCGAQRLRASGQAHRQRRARRRHRSRRPRRGGHAGGRPRRRGGAQRARARALRLPRGACRRRQAGHRGFERDGRARAPSAPAGGVAT
jgi:ATP-dependent RNA helicase DeaD